MIKNKIEGVKPFNKFWLKSCYSNLLSLLWKMWRQENFSFAVTRRDGILRRIDSVKETEEKVYDCLWEACA